jgi:cytosine permease
VSTENITSSPVAPGTGADDFAASRVPPDRLQSAWDISLVRMGLTVSASDLVFGYTVGLYFSFWQAIGISLLISLIVLVISLGMGAIGLRERLTFALSARFAFGREGSRLPSLVMTVIIAAFYGYILAVTADVFPDVKNGAVQVLYCLGLGVLMVAVSALGFARGLKWIGRVGVPLMVVLVIVADAVTITHDHGFGAIVHARPALAGQISLAAILGAGIAKWTGGAAISADVMRFARSSRALFASTAAEFLVGNFGFNLLGLILGLGLRSSDLGAALGLVGLTWLATVAFLIQGITVETNELYAASLASSNALGLSRRTSNIAVGVLGLIIGYIGLSHGATTSFLTFINYVSYALPAIPGIILADYFVVNRMRYRTALADLAAVNWRAVTAYIAAVALSLITGLGLGDQVWRILPLFGFVIYLALSIPQVAAAWRAPRTTAAAGAADDLATAQPRVARDLPQEG